MESDKRKVILRQAQDFKVKNRSYKWVGYKLGYKLNDMTKKKENSANKNELQEFSEFVLLTNESSVCANFAHATKNSVCRKSRHTTQQLAIIRLMKKIRYEKRTHQRTVFAV